MTDSRAWVITSGADWIVYIMLLVQVLTGVIMAVGYGWGSSWFATLATPYIWSLFALRPDISTIAPLPWVIKLHMVMAFALFAFAPFTRLVHILVAPIPYLWRKPQIVRWYKRSASITY
jgi:nitrate reductase gamma subunit